MKNLTLILIGLWTVPVCLAVEFEVIRLGTLGGSFSSLCRDTLDGFSPHPYLNDSGHVVGKSETAAGETHAFHWTAERGMLDLGTLGGEFSEAKIVNALGHVAGSSTLPNGDSHALFWTPER